MEREEFGKVQDVFKALGQNECTVYPGVRGGKEARRGQGEQLR